MKAPCIHIAILIAFLVNTFGPVPAQAQDFRLPAPGVMIRLSPVFNPPILKGIKIHSDNPFKLDFILDKGDSRLSNDALKDESGKLIKYFLASLTIPEKDLWVNLSPYEKNRIIPNSFGLTEMGRDLLAEDYMLKQITASLIYPEDALGKKFWNRIYEEAMKKFGTTNIPVNTFNKVWILPEKAVVYENAKVGAAYVVESKLKVMLEQDYLSLQKHEGISSEVQSQEKETNQLGSQVVREIIIPQLTKEVNKNKNFSQLRQIYNSLILATWYKKKIKDSILEQVYADKNKVAGVNIDDPVEKEKIYQRYLQAFKKGVYNYIKEDIDPLTQETIPRKYFSGGVDCAMIGEEEANVLELEDTLPNSIRLNNNNSLLIESQINTAGEAPVLPTDFAMSANTPFDLNDLPEELKAIALTDEERAVVIQDLISLHERALVKAEELKRSSDDPTLYTITIREAQRYLSEFARVFDREIVSGDRVSALMAARNAATYIYDDFLDLFSVSSHRNYITKAEDKLNRALDGGVPTLFIRPVDSLNSLEMAVANYQKEHLDTEVETITGTPFTDSQQIIGGMMPVEGNNEGQQPLKYQKGVVYRLQELAKAHPEKTYILKIDQMEAIPSKVRAQLNEYLLRGELNVAETGEKLTLPSNLKIIASITQGARIEDEAFYERFVRKVLDPIDLANGEELKQIVSQYGFSPDQGIKIEHFLVSVVGSEPIGTILIFLKYLKGRIEDGESLEDALDAEYKLVWGISIEHHLHYDPEEGNLIIDGVRLPVSDNLKKELVGILTRDSQVTDIARVLKEKTGLVITQDVLAALSVASRTLRYGNGILRLEGPTGAGKTYIAECLAKIMGVSYYGEPIHGESKQNKWLGQFNIDENGNYYLDQDTPFLGILQHGGVMALSELNTAVKDDYAKLGWWLVPLARGDNTIYLNEYPGLTNGEGQSKSFQRSPSSLIIIDTNPESYQARGQLPPMLNAYVPVVNIQGQLTKEELEEIAADYLKSIPEGERDYFATRLAAAHYRLQEELNRPDRDIAKDMEFIITLRQLKNACEMIIRHHGQMNNEENLYEALVGNYVFSFNH